MARTTSGERAHQAEVELGHTDVSPRLAVSLTLVFLASLLLVPLLQLRGAPPGFAGLFRSVPTACSLQRFERRLEDNSVAGNWVLPRLQAFLSGVLGVGNEKVVLGENGWLYHLPDVDYVIGRPFLDPGVLKKRRLASSACEGPPQPDPVEAIARFSEQLAARGIRLVALPIPVKPVAAPGQLARVSVRGPLQNPAFDAFVSTLAARGVDVFDPTPLLVQDGSFLATDTHWRPEAAERVGSALAEHLESLGVLSPAPRIAYQRVALEAEHEGDLALILSLPAGQTLYPPERVQIEQVREDGAPWRPKRGAEALVIGDSFTNMYSDPAAFPSGRGVRDGGWGESAGLAEQLSFGLRRPVDRLARNGGGAHLARADLAREVAREAEAGVDRLAGVRVLVWEFAVKDLAQGDWKEVDLAPRAAASAQVAAAPRSGAPALIHATIAACAEPPQRGSVPYRDALIACHVTGTATDTGAQLPAEAVVYLFGMRDNAWTDAAQLSRGARVALRVEPWESESVQQRVGSLNRAELDDLALISLPAFYGELAAPESAVR